MNSNEWIDLDTALFHLEKEGVEVDVPKEKIVKKIYSLINHGLLAKPFCIDTITTLDLDEFSQIPTVGKQYIQSLFTLQEELSALDLVVESSFEDYSFRDLYCIVPELNKDLYLIHKGLSEKEIKLLKSLVKYIGDTTVDNILRLDKTREYRLYNFTKKRLNALQVLLRKISEEVNTKIKNGIGFIPGDSDLIASNGKSLINDLPIEELLIEDIEDFIFKQDDKEQYIILSRTGYNYDLSTLEEISQNYDCTRERIRQIEKKIRQNLTLSLRVSPDLIRTYVLQYSEDDSLGFPVLSTFFDNTKLFFDFIEGIIGSNEKISSEIFEPITNKSILNDFISLNAEPYKKIELINELISSFGMHFVKASRTLGYLIEEGIIQNKNDFLKPIKLGKKEAISQVLLNFPEGLPWKDVVNIVNSKGYTTKPMTLTRLDAAFTSAEYVYQYEHGTYRHICFSDFEDLDIDELLQCVKRFLSQLSSGACHVMEFYSKERENCESLSYFDVRHLIREYADLYGVYFNGRSGQDSISLDKDINPGGQESMIINALNDASTPLSKLEITELLVSKSARHAGFYLSELMADNRVIRIENMLYTTPKKAFEGINIEQVLEKIRKIIFSTNLPIEADVFRQKLNGEFAFSYSKYFYASLANIYLDKLKAHKRRSFISQKPIPFDGLTDLSSQVCLKSLSYEDNIRRLKEYAVLTDSVARNAVFRGIEN